MDESTLQQIISRLKLIETQVGQTKVNEKAIAVVGYVTTIDATVTTLATVTIPASTTVFIEALVSARRTGGSAGTAEDGAGYVIRGTYKNVAGTATLIGAVNADYTAESQAAWDATLTISGGSTLVRVTGAVNNNVSWYCTARVYQISS